MLEQALACLRGGGNVRCRSGRRCLLAPNNRSTTKAITKAADESFSWNLLEQATAQIVGLPLARGAFLAL